MGILVCGFGFGLFVVSLWVGFASFVVGADRIALICCCSGCSVVCFGRLRRAVFMLG